MSDGDEGQVVPEEDGGIQARSDDSTCGDPGNIFAGDAVDNDQAWADDLLACLDLPADKVLNEEPLGHAGEGREYADVCVHFERLRRGQKYLDENVRKLKSTLVINTHAIYAYGYAASDCVLQDGTAKALRQVPVLSEKAYRKALARLTSSDSTAIHETALRDEVQQAITSGRQVQRLEHLLRIRQVLRKGLDDAKLMAKRHQNLKRENLLKHRKPSRDVQYRTFTPFLLRDPTKFHVEEMSQMIQNSDDILNTSAVEPNELWILAFYGQINAGTVYIDFDFMGDLLQLTVYAGAFALGARQPMNDDDTATYGRMLCEGGEDTKAEESRPGRATYAESLRQRWREVPGLFAATEHLGRLVRDD